MKTADDLKQAISFTPTIRLTLGHPEGGRIRRSDFLGYVKPTWDEKTQSVLGDFWFYEEHLDKIPENIRQKIVNNEPWRISTAFTVTGVEKGVQKGTFFDHVAILRENEDAVCPLNKCGINITAVRQESEARDMYYEQAQSATEPAPKKEPEKAMEEPEWAKELAKTVRAVLEKFVTVQKPEEPKQPVPQPELQTPEAPKIATPTPRRVIPAGETKSPEEEMKVDPVSGMILLG